MLCCFTAGKGLGVLSLLWKHGCCTNKCSAWAPVAGAFSYMYNAISMFLVCLYHYFWHSFALSPFSIPPNWKSCTARLPRRVPSRSKWWPHRLRELSSGLCRSTRKLNTSLKWSNAAQTTSWAGSSTRVRRAVLCWQSLCRVAWLMSSPWGMWQQLQSKPSGNRPPCDTLCSFLFPVLGRKDHAINALVVSVHARPWEESTEINLVPAQVRWMSVPMAGTAPLAALLCSAFAPAMRSSCSCAEEWASMWLGQGSSNRMQYHLQCLIHTSETGVVYLWQGNAKCQHQL